MADWVFYGIKTLLILDARCCEMDMVKLVALNGLTTEADWLIKIVVVLLMCFCSQGNKRLAVDIVVCCKLVRESYCFASESWKLNKF